MKLRHGGIGLLMIWIALPLTGDAAADEIGRLFSTVAERARLDALRSGKIGRSIRKADAEPPATPQNPLHGAVAFNGVVRSSTGKEIIWINGDRRRKDHGPHGIRIQRRKGNSYEFSIDGYDRSARMRPGQRWNPATGQVSEGIDRPEKKEPAVETPKPDGAEETGGGA